jgi:hypothetical protein
MGSKEHVSEYMFGAADEWMPESKAGDELQREASCRSILLHARSEVE